MVFSGLLMLGLVLAIINGYRDSDVRANGNASPAKLKSSMPLPSEPLQPVSRGASAGVSEKSNLVLAGVNVMSFPWNNTMLSWQRTAYHFQPEKNWMNGKFI
jgi:beta-fructofuranosidase